MSRRFAPWTEAQGLRAATNKHSPSERRRDMRLFFDDAAGDAIARVAGWVGHQIIGFRVDHE